MTNYVFPRASGYYLRYVIPRRYRKLLQPRELRYTLHTHSRRLAARRARSVVSRVDVLLSQLERNAVILNDKSITDTIRAYVRDACEQIGDWHLARPPRDADEAEAHVGILLSDLRGLQAALASPNFSGRAGRRASYADDSFSGDIEAEVCTLFELDSATVDRADLQFKKACRAWATARAALLADHLKRLSGEPTAFEPDYLAPLVAPSAVATAAQVKPQGPRISEVIDGFLQDRAAGKPIRKTTSSRKSGSWPATSTARIDSA